MKYCCFCMNEIGEKNICPACGKEQPGSFSAHHLQPGTLLQGKYLIGASLGEGGFGITYMGLNVKLDLKVAIKEFYPNGYVNRATAISKDLTCINNEVGRETFEKGKERFLQEAKVLARFSGEEGVVYVHDLFEENNTAYIVMEYLEGMTLKTYLDKKKRLAPEETLNLLRPVMNTLGRVHKAGLIHRDISPDNIMMLSDGKIKLLDFGAARDVSGDASLSVMLKHGFAPEEQYRRKGMQGPWTDVYALCATIYKCITGVTPDDSSERVLDDQLLRPSAYGIKVDPVYEAALMKGLGVLAKNRYRSMGELLDGFDGKDSSLVIAPPEETAVKKQITPDEDPDKTVYGGGEPADDPDKTVYGGDISAKETPADPDKTVYSEDPYFRPSVKEETPTYSKTHEPEPDENKKRSKKGLFIALAAVAVIALAVALAFVFDIFKTPATVPHTSEESVGTIIHTSKEDANSLPDSSAQESSAVNEISAEPSASEESAPETSVTEESSAAVHVHEFGEWAVIIAATCTEDGTKERVCSCGEKQTDVIPATGHSYGEWVVTKPATDTENGVETKTCSVCGDKVTRSIDMITHNYVAVVTKPTCTEQGYTTYTCSDCGKSYVDDYTKPLGHDWGAPTYSWNSDLSKVTATCTCSHDSSHKQTETVNTTSSVTKAATCEGTGTKTYTVTFKNSAFSKQTKTETIAALGHNYENGICIRCGNEKSSSGLEYSDTRSGYSVIGIGSCTDKTLVIPSTYNGKPVTSIGYGAFEDCSSLVSVTIPDSVTIIGAIAFSHCTGLTSITIPDSVTIIGDVAFEYCNGLTSVTIGNSVTSIGKYAFHGCSSLTSITIPDSVMSIGAYAFNGCEGLADKDGFVIVKGILFDYFGGDIAEIPDSITSIGCEAFFGCSSLTSITIPDSVTSIGDYAFFYCSSLNDINFTGTKAQWNNIEKESNWDIKTGSYVIHCTDGDIQK